MVFRCLLALLMNFLCCQMLIDMTRVARSREPLAVTLRKVENPWRPIESLDGINVILVQLEVRLESMVGWEHCSRGHI